jgi:hypothetical protein
LQYVFDNFKQNQLAINNIQQLIHLLADIQRHRACSLAILSGNHSFEAQVNALHKKINARLYFLDNEFDLLDIIDRNEWNHVANEWKVVGYGWRKDDILHNFELHCHLLDKILNIIRHTGRWILRSGSYSEQAGNQFLEHSIFEFIFATHLYHIESLGRLRGLGTHIANCGCNDESMYSRIKYLLQCARKEQEISTEFLNQHNTTAGKTMPAAIEIQLTKHLLDEWLELTENILQKNIQPSEELARKAFELASAVMDARLALTEQVLAYLHLAIENMLEFLLEENATMTTEEKTQ